MSFEGNFFPKHIQNLKVVFLKSSEYTLNTKSEQKEGFLEYYSW